MKEWSYVYDDGQQKGVIYYAVQYTFLCVIEGMHLCNKKKYLKLS